MGFSIRPIVEPQLEQIKLPEAEAVRIRLPSQSAQNIIRFSRVRLTLRLGILSRFSQVLLLRKLRVFTLLNICSMAINVPCLFSNQTVNAFILTIACNLQAPLAGQTAPHPSLVLKCHEQKRKGDGRIWDCNVMATLGLLWWRMMKDLYLI